MMNISSELPRGLQHATPLGKILMIAPEGSFQNADGSDRRLERLFKG